MKGQRLEDTPIGQTPRSVDQESEGLPPPGSYWKVLTPDGTHPIDVHTKEGRYWGTGPKMLKKYAENLTGTVWGVIDPNGNFGMLSIHTVREEEDGTISIRPGDGSSNSVLISSPTPDGEPRWHGYIEHGEWKELG